MTERHRYPTAEGAVTAFDLNNYWGRLMTPYGEVTFHSTCYQGAFPPKVGDLVEVVFSESASAREKQPAVLSVHFKYRL